MKLVSEIKNQCVIFFPLKIYCISPRQVFKVGGRPNGKSQKVVDNILKYFPDFDAFPLSPPSADAEVIKKLTDVRAQDEINSAFKKGVQNFKQILLRKLGPKKRYGGPGLVTGEGLLKACYYIEAA